MIDLDRVGIMVLLRLSPGWNAGHHLSGDAKKVAAIDISARVPPLDNVYALVDWCEMGSRRIRYWDTFIFYVLNRILF